MIKKNISAFTDGSFTKTRLGGWGVYFYYKTPKDVRVSFSCQGTDNNNHQTMEIKAISECLNNLPYNSDITLYSDSSYALQGIVKFTEDRELVINTKRVSDKYKFTASTLQTRLNRVQFTGWCNNWGNNGWKTTKNESVKNKELWIEIMDRINVLYKNNCIIKFKWVKGHSGNEGNEIADKLANGKLKL